MSDSTMKTGTGMASGATMKAGKTMASDATMKAGTDGGDTLRCVVIHRPHERYLNWAVELVRDSGKEMPLIMEECVAAFKERRHADFFRAFLEEEGVARKRT